MVYKYIVIVEVSQKEQEGVDWDGEKEGGMAGV